MAERNRKLRAAQDEQRRREGALGARFAHWAAPTWEETGGEQQEEGDDEDFEIELALVRFHSGWCLFPSFLPSFLPCGTFTFRVRGRLRKIVAVDVL